MCPTTNHGIGMLRKDRIHLFQLSMALLFNRPHLSFRNFDCAHRSGSLSSTHTANSRWNFLNSSIAIPYSAALAAYATLFSISFRRSFVDSFLYPYFAAALTKFSRMCLTQYV
uniref:Uncharacterized protein n=1 Tax=Opuntia streptacantha TaxID=393608 RepID=A0A7C8YYH7_OPUST